MYVSDHIDCELLPEIDRLLGHETEIHMRDGEVLQGVPMERSQAFSSTQHVTFEEAHGDYRCLDVDEIESIHEAA